MRDRGGQSKKPARGTLRDQYHLKNYGYKSNTSQLHPRKIADGILQSIIGQNVGQTTANFRHPVKRLEHKGSIMEVPFGFGPRFKFPEFMGPVARRTGEVDPRFGIPHVENTHIWDDLHEGKLGYQFEKRIGHLGPRTPLSPGHMVAKNDSFLAHLARLQDPQANREFLNWMIEHHYRRPN
jgi:hypothetical protein